MSYSEKHMELIDKCETVEELFAIWVKAHQEEPEEEIKGCLLERNSFVADGNVYDNIKKHNVLFVLREANIENYRECEQCNPEERSQKEWYKQFCDCKNVNKKSWGDNRPKQLEKMGRMYLELCDKNEQLEISDIAKRFNKEDYHEAVKRIAFININKRGGGNKDNGYAQKYAESYKYFIKKQIEIINPEYIVCCGKGIDLIINKIIENSIEKPKVISMWHTSYRPSKNTSINLTDNNESNDQNIRRYISHFRTLLNISEA